MTKTCVFCRANAEIAQVRGKAQQEQAAYQASLRKEQLKVDALERTLEQKVNQESALPGAKLCLRIVLQLPGAGDSSTAQILGQNPPCAPAGPGFDLSPSAQGWLSLGQSSGCTTAAQALVCFNSQVSDLALVLPSGSVSLFSASCNSSANSKVSVGNAYLYLCVLQLSQGSLLWHSTARPCLQLCKTG